MTKQRKSAWLIGPLAIASGLLLFGGCSADPKGVYRAVKEIEPAAEKRNEELRELSGMPAEEPD